MSQKRPALTSTAARSFYSETTQLPKYNPAYQPESPYKVYNAKAIHVDKEFIQRCTESMDSLLVFAGLFSAVTTALIVESYKSLKPEPSDRTEQLLAALLLWNGNHHAPYEDIPAAPFSPAKHLVITNAMFFLSLSLSLCAALGALLVKQWTRNAYMGLSVITLPRERARKHYQRMDGIRSSYLVGIMEAIPMMLHISLLLFFVGLSFWLGSLNLTICIVVVVASSCALILYVIAAVRPSFRPQSPYQWPPSIAIASLIESLRPLFSKPDTKPDTNATVTSLPKGVNIPLIPVTPVTHVTIGGKDITTTPIKRIEGVEEPKDGLLQDKLDLDIMSTVLNDPETADNIVGVVDAFTKAMLQPQSSMSRSLILNDGLLRSVVEKAYHALALCRGTLGESRSTVTKNLNQVVLFIQFYEIALQTFDFDPIQHLDLLKGVLDVSIFYWERAILAESLEEIVLMGSTAMRIQDLLLETPNVDRMNRAALALIRQGPLPPQEIKANPEPRTWSIQDIAWYQSLISPYVLLTMRLVKSASLRGATASLVEQGLEDLGENISSVIFQGRYYARYWSLSKVQHPELITAMSLFWSECQGIPDDTEKFVKKVLEYGLRLEPKIEPNGERAVGPLD
ncbi:hypothetical protein PIIN_09261 [Serendipita indica DSM 11827]|uniref:DUF6535 domain-containing protein n=1 Tax=Serendipita indica (strain DSM 11827) TaxID=1109443 RepID=G4TVD4_SERID|nr:hypothetical protein PIIN_09261 [Serendipita indica DSM 11827]